MFEFGNEFKCFSCVSSPVPENSCGCSCAWHELVFYRIGALTRQTPLDSSRSVYRANVCVFYLSLQWYFKGEFLRGHRMFSDNKIGKSLK